MNSGVTSAVKIIFLAGMTLGLLDFADALVFFGWYLDLGIQPVFQGVAAGLIGRDSALAGGWNTWLLGVGLHFIVAFGVATVYYIASRFIPVLLRKPIVCGLFYGVLCHFVMQFVVIPLSKIGRWPTFTLRTTLNGVIGHALLVGLPAALVISWSANKVSTDQI